MYTYTIAMPNQNIIQYLDQHKNSFEREALRAQLLSSGYIEQEVDEAIRLVYGNSFHETAGKGTIAQKKKLYTKSTDMTFDFVMGLLVIPWINLIPVLGWIVFIGLLFYFFNARRWIFYGMTGATVFLLMFFILISTSYNWW